RGQPPLPEFQLGPQRLERLLHGRRRGRRPCPPRRPGQSRRHSRPLIVGDVPCPSPSSSPLPSRSAPPSLVQPPAAPHPPHLYPALRSRRGPASSAVTPRATLVSKATFGS